MEDRGGPDRAITSGTTHVLAIYALPSCPGWNRAAAIVEMVLDAAIAGLDVRLIDLSRVEGPPPLAVIASPTWILNGRRIALGNPDPDWLLAILSETPEGAFVNGNSGA